MAHRNLMKKAECRMKKALALGCISLMAGCATTGVAPEPYPRDLYGSVRAATTTTHRVLAAEPKTDYRTELVTFNPKHVTNE